MRKNVVGWLVRTEAGSHHRYWKVGFTEASQAEAIALDLANANVARATSELLSHYLAKYLPLPNIGTEITWEATPIGLPVQRDRSGANACVGEKNLLEITFDTIVPPGGTSHIEGCYRFNRGNWQVYYLFVSDESAPCAIPVVNKSAVFSSGISGIIGTFPADWLLTKELVSTVLIEAVGANWSVEVAGPDSLWLK